MASALVPLADGFEEMEAVTIVDILRRAGVDVVTAGLRMGLVKASRGMAIAPDMALDEALKREYDIIVLPGGLPGATNLEADARINDLLKKMANSGKFTGAICAAPVVLAKAGLLAGKKATSYPGFLDKMQLPGVTYTGDAVTRDGKVVTSRGPGTAIDFSLEIVDMLCGKETRDKVEAGLVRN
jgi:4-methyl-5(b-hydroxyethyl)-thiazole monophosphate biosynthesis